MTACYRGITYEIPFTPQVRFELNVPDESLDIVVESIIGAARTGKPGDGKIFVTQLAEVVEINLNLPVPPLHIPTAPRPHPSLWRRQSAEHRFNPPVLSLLAAASARRTRLGRAAFRPAQVGQASHFRPEQ